MCLLSFGWCLERSMLNSISNRDSHKSQNCLFNKRKLTYNNRTKNSVRVMLVFTFHVNIIFVQN